MGLRPAGGSFPRMSFPSGAWKQMFHTASFAMWGVATVSWLRLAVVQAPRFARTAKRLCHSLARLWQLNGKTPSDKTYIDVARQKKRPSILFFLGRWGPRQVI